MKPKLVNLTKHTVSVFVEGKLVAEFPPSGNVAECRKKLVCYGRLARPAEGEPVDTDLSKIPMYFEQGHPVIEGLPAPEDNVILIVTRDVFDATPHDNGLTERLDVITPKLVLGNAAVCDGFICH